jgi:hypothetical protein
MQVDSAECRTKAKGKPRGGSRKGCPNKVQQAAKDLIAQAAHELGGMNRLVQWAREDALNERAFWATIYPKLLPLQVTGEGGGALRIVASTADERL